MVAIATNRVGSRRARRVVRPKTISAKQLPRYVLEAGSLIYPHDSDGPERPRTLGECADHELACCRCERVHLRRELPTMCECGAWTIWRCPWVACRYHLYLDVMPRTGSIKLNFPDLEPWEMEPCCALEVIDDRSALTLEDVGELFNITRERIRQIELRAFVSFARSAYGIGINARGLLEGRDG